MIGESWSDDENHTLQLLVSNIDFVENGNALQRYQCQCCQRVVLVPHIAECHHIFCDKCINKIVHKKCPNKQCGNESIEKLTHDEALQTEVSQLKIYCQFRKHGCEETFPLQNYFIHPKTCKYISEGLLSINLQKINEILPSNSMDEQSVSSRLCAMEQNIEMIKENEKHYNQAFVVLKEIEKMLKDQGYKPKYKSENLTLGSENKSQLQKDETRKPMASESIEGNVEKIADTGTVKVDDYTEIKTSICQMEEKLSAIEKGLISLKSNGTKDLGVDFREDMSGNQFEIMLKEQIDLVKEEFNMIQKSQFQEQKTDFESKFQELGNQNDNIMFEIDKLREVEKSPLQATLIPENQFKQYEDDLIKIKNTMKALEEHVVDIVNQVTLLEEHHASSSVENMEKIQDGDETFPDKVHWRGRKQLEDNEQNKAVNNLETRLEALERMSESMLCELKQIKNGGLDNESARINCKDNEETKSYCCKMDTIGTKGVLPGSTEFTWELTGFGDILANFQNNVLQEIESSIFSTMDSDYEMRAKLMLYKDFLSIYLAFVAREEGEENPPVYFHRRTFIVLDQGPLEGKRRDLVRSWEPSFGSKNSEKWMKEFWGSLHFVPLDLLENGNRYVKNDTIRIKIVIEPLAALYKVLTANDGVLFWKVDGYAAHKEREMGGLTQGLKSDYFYSSPKGYRLQIELCLNGHGEENKEHVSAFVWFRRGPFDDFLSKRFAHRTTIWILDQSDGEEKVHLRKVVQLNQIRNTIYSKLALQSTIEDPRYLKNDAILMKVIVEPVEDNEAIENECT